jgi:AI-2 transport protein TqsA
LAQAQHPDFAGDGGALVDRCVNGVVALLLPGGRLLPAEHRLSSPTNPASPLAANRPPILHILIGGACAVILLAGARAVADLLNPVLFAGFLALLLQPVLDRLRRYGGAAVFILVLAVLITGLALVGFVAITVRQVALEIPTYEAQFDSLIESIKRQFEARNINAASYIDAALRGPEVRAFILGASSAIAGAFGSAVLTLFIFAFMLGGMSEMERRASTEAQDHSPLAATFLGYSARIRGYMGVRAVLGMAAAILEYIVLVILGIEYALLWAVFSFLLSFVPNIGFFLSMIPPILLGLLEHGWVTALIVFAAYQLINTLVDNVVGPRFIGRQMKVSPLLSFLSVLFWAWVLGPIGAILSVPLTVLIRDLTVGPAEEGAVS